MQLLLNLQSAVQPHLPHFTTTLKPLLNIPKAGYVNISVQCYIKRILR